MFERFLFYLNPLFSQELRAAVPHPAAGAGHICVLPLAGHVRGGREQSASLFGSKLYFVLCLTSLFSYTSRKYQHFAITLESLLICIVAGYVCTNASAHRHRFMLVLGKLGPYVFLPFFTCVLGVTKPLLIRD